MTSYPRVDHPTEGATGKMFRKRSVGVFVNKLFFSERLEGVLRFVVLQAALRTADSVSRFALVAMQLECLSAYLPGLWKVAEVCSWEKLHSSDPLRARPPLQSYLLSYLAFAQASTSGILNWHNPEYTGELAMLLFDMFIPKFEFTNIEEVDPVDAWAIIGAVGGVWREFASRQCFVRRDDCFCCLFLLLFVVLAVLLWL